MFHFLGAITNTKGDALPGYFVQLTDSGGNVVPIYSDQNATPIISVSGVSNMALVNSDGMADFYVNPGEYTLNVYAADASTLDRGFANVPMGLNTITLASGATVTSRSALSDIALPVDGQSALLAEVHYEGIFVFSAANLSSSVSADPGQWEYVAPSSDTTGASGAWVRKSRTKLTADLTLYVRADGSDSHDGSANTSGSAMATIQHAVDVAYKIFDCDGHKITIQIADGVTGQSVTINGKLVGAKDASAQPLQIIGNETTPANVSFSLSVSDYAYVLLAGVTIANAGGVGLSLTNLPTVEHRNCVFGACSAERILALGNSYVHAIGATTVSGAAQSFVHATERSLVDFGSQALTFSSATHSVYLWGLNDASVHLDSATITGSATGGITVHRNAILNVTSVTGQWWGSTYPVVEDGGRIAADAFPSRNLYVRPSGNDNNPGFVNSDAGAFATITAAVNALSKMPYDPSAWDANNGWVIQASGVHTYNETVNLQDVPYRWVILLGDEGTPSNVVIQGSGHGVAATGTKTRWYVRGFRIHATSGDSLHAEQGGQITFRNIECGSATGAQLFAYVGGRLIAEGNYSIVTSAPIHARAWANATIDIHGNTVTLTGTPAYSSYFAEARLNGLIRADGCTFTGSATGTKYYAETGGVIYANGGTLPGSLAGSTGTGGQYA
jgi:hypothetical protein